MINAIVSMPSPFYGNSITEALTKTGKFRVRNLKRCSEKGILTACRDARADVVLMGVSVVQSYTLPERTEIARQIRARFPDCKIILFVDENVSDAQTAGITMLRQVRIIDGFLYASGSMEYLVATMESII